MHDGPVWPLYLKQSMLPLPRSWKPETFPSGDALGESMKLFEQDFTLAEALDIQFRSGHSILRFYTMRNALLDSPSDAGNLLAGMKNIVREEIENSLLLAELCRQDSRPGYHSEAEVYKYFPEKLQWRAGLLEHLLASDFPEAEDVLRQGGDIGDFRHELRLNLGYAYPDKLRRIVL